MNRSNIIGRTEEIAILEKCVNSPESEFVVVYGRRRVGKTYLVNEFFSDGFTFKTTGLYKKRTREQLVNFAHSLKDYGRENGKVPGDWFEAFSELKQLIVQKRKKDEGKKIIFIDELPWLDTPKSDFLAGFEAFWNGWGAQQHDVLLIVCGSATTWITEKLLENVGGLFNRATRRIYLQAFTLQETESFLLSRGFRWNRYTLTQTYMIMGGIPFYLRLLDYTLSFSENIDRLFFKTGGALWNEFSILYETLFGRSEIYLKIISALAEKKSGMTRDELSSKTGLPKNGDFSKALKNLSDCQFIRIYAQFGKKRDNIHQLCDYYTLFYLKFIRNNEGKDEHFWSHSMNNPSVTAWMGYTFEQVCKDHLLKIKQTINISDVLTSISSWYGSNGESKAQIDLLIDRRDQVINLCEIKFSVSEFSIDKDYEMVLRRKISVFKEATKTRKAIQIIMITTYGLRKNSHSELVHKTIVLDNLFE